MGSPAASPQTEELDWSRFWISALLENIKEDKLAALNGLTDGFEPPHQPTVSGKLKDAETSHSAATGGNESEPEPHGTFYFFMLSKLLICLRSSWIKATHQPVRLCSDGAAAYPVEKLYPDGMGMHFLRSLSQPQYGSRERMHSLHVSPYRPQSASGSRCTSIAVATYKCP